MPLEGLDMPRLTQEAYDTILVDLAKKSKRDGYVEAWMQFAPRIPETFTTEKRAELAAAFRLTAEAEAERRFP